VDSGAEVQYALTIENVTDSLGEYFAGNYILGSPKATSYTPTFLDDNTAKLLQTLQHMSHWIDVPGPGLKDKQELSIVLYQTEHLLLSNIYEQARSLEYNSVRISLLSEAFSTSALLYLHLFIREMPSTSKIHHRLLFRLQFILQEMTSYDLGRLENRDVLLWIMFVAISASSSHPIRQYFIETQVTIELDVQYQNIYMIRERLKGIVWRKRVCEDYLTKIWKDMRSQIGPQASDS